MPQYADINKWVEFDQAFSEGPANDKLTTRETTDGRFVVRLDIFKLKNSLMPRHIKVLAVIEDVTFPNSIET